MKALVVAGIALLVGIAIAWVDSRPTWDDAGITAAALVVTAAAASAGGVSWWVASILVCGPLVLTELWHGPGVLIGIPFAVGGAFLGVYVRRYSRRS